VNSLGSLRGSRSRGSVSVYIERGKPRWQWAVGFGLGLGLESLKVVRSLMHAQRLPVAAMNCALHLPCPAWGGWFAVRAPRTGFLASLQRGPPDKAHTTAATTAAHYHSSRIPEAADDSAM
jgi:hypothetical protein